MIAITLMVPYVNFSNPCSMLMYRSDGKEVLVDDKELKANNPLLLISFYEQHLRYSPNQ
ncbi:hypothetical protein BHE74_00008837 [Ensete ventricosum]|nr:hypothetical protein BHE74_00008837 [Ensete ventricosum]RZR83655.1 hypothetical protein BHM03_00010330 [Ensete ventricosum]